MVAVRAAVGRGVEELDVLNAFEDLVALSRLIGVGGREVPTDWWARLVHGITYVLFDQSAVEGVLEPAAVRDVGVFNAAAIMLGLLGGDDPREVAQRLGRFADSERLHLSSEMWNWAPAKDLSLLALNLQFCLREQRFASTLVGAANPQELEADIAATTAYIPEVRWEEFRQHFGLSSRGSN